MKGKFNDQKKVAKQLLLDHLDREKIKSSLRDAYCSDTSILDFVLSIKRSPRQRSLAASISTKEIIESAISQTKEEIGMTEIAEASLIISNIRDSGIQEYPHLCNYLQKYPSLTPTQFKMITSYLKRKKTF